MRSGTCITCSEDSCHKTFSTQEALFEHLAVERHTADLASDSKLDTIARKWAEKVSQMATSSHHPTSTESKMSVTPSPSKNGWAVKAKKKSKRLSAAVKYILFEEFIRGVETGRNENPGLVSRKIKPRFPQDDWLTTQQVASYRTFLAELANRNVAT